MNEKNPSSLTGISSNSPQYKKYILDLIHKSGNADWRPADGENFYDMLERVRTVLQYIHEETVGDVVVVSHGFFLRCLIGYLYTHSDDLELYARKLLHSLFLENTGITHAQVNKEGEWRLVSINDSTHLS